MPLEISFIWNIWKHIKTIQQSYWTAVTTIQMGINDTTKQIPTFLNVFFNILDNNIHPVIQNKKNDTWKCSSAKNEDCILYSPSIVNAQILCKTTWRRVNYLRIVFFGVSCSFNDIYHISHICSQITMSRLIPLVSVQAKVDSVQHMDRNLHQRKIMAH